MPVPPSMSWLAPRTFHALMRDGHEWRFRLDGDVEIVVESLWRLLKDDQLVATSEDDGHQFGLPAPMNAAAEVNTALAGRTLEHADSREGTGDLTLRFSGGYVLEFLTSSAGYEAWRAAYPGGCIVAAGSNPLTANGAPPPSARQ
ncbi:MAG: hypothetical protein KF902_00795 [Phycisphaeraceae bacterium]|nr:hypothetical protein [Phycisphaeraceae bacterium]